MTATYPNAVSIIEVGLREGFQFEGIRDPQRIPFRRKLELITAVASTGLRTIQVVSFVSPKLMPQMADAEAICAALPEVEHVDFTGVYLNDKGLERALVAPNLRIFPDLLLSASEQFALRNQRRTLDDEVAMQRKMAAAYQQHGLKVDQANIMAAFGSNFDEEVPISRVIDMISRLMDIAVEHGGKIQSANLADTMGWANPDLVRRTVGAIRQRWPDITIGLHLHDTRGLAIANVHAGLLEGVQRFDTGLAGLGGCPFAGNDHATGNVATEEVLFLCEQLGIHTGVDLAAVVECARLAEDVVGHRLPSTLISAPLKKW